MVPVPIRTCSSKASIRGLLRSRNAQQQPQDALTTILSVSWNDGCVMTMGLLTAVQEALGKAAAWAPQALAVSAHL